MTLPKYKILRSDRANGDIEVGDEVYELHGYDLGLASDDTRATGIKHITVTKNENGDYPGFTIPLIDLEVIK